jgi:hypothetical protein
MSTLGLMLGAAALAAPPPREVAAAAPHRTTVMVSPLGPVGAVVATAAGTPALDANLKVHHMVGRRVGLTAQVDHLRAHVMDMDATHTSLRAGPRFALRDRGLADWTLTPSGSIGYATLSAADEELMHYTLLGVGLDAGRTWVWKRLSMEVGLGAYSTFAVGYRTSAEALADEEPESVSPIKPNVTWSLGYAF